MSKVNFMMNAELWTNAMISFDKIGTLHSVMQVTFNKGPLSIVEDKDQFTCSWTQI